MPLFYVLFFLQTESGQTYNPDQISSKIGNTASPMIDFDFQVKDPALFAQKRRSHFPPVFSPHFLRLGLASLRYCANRIGAVCHFILSPSVFLLLRAAVYVTFLPEPGSVLFSFSEDSELLCPSPLSYSGSADEKTES